MSKFYLVPESSIRLAKGGQLLTQERAWAEVLRKFHERSSLRDAAEGVISMLREIDVVKISQNKVTVNDELKYSVSAIDLVRNLSDDSSLIPSVKIFLRRLMEVAGASAPEAIAITTRSNRNLLTKFVSRLQALFVKLRAAKKQKTQAPIRREQRKRASTISIAAIN
jgi:hypothetical protein